MSRPPRKEIYSLCIVESILLKLGHACSNKKWANMTQKILANTFIYFANRGIQKCKNLAGSEKGLKKSFFATPTLIFLWRIFGQMLLAWKFLLIYPICSCEIIMTLEKPPRFKTKTSRISLYDIRIQCVNVGDPHMSLRCWITAAWDKDGFITSMRKDINESFRVSSMKVKWQVWRWNDSFDLSADSFEVCMWSIRGHKIFDSATGWGFLTQNLLIANCFMAKGIENRQFQDKKQHIWNCRCVTTARKKPVENDLNSQQILPN